MTRERQTEEARIHSYVKKLSKTEGTSKLQGALIRKVIFAFFDYLETKGSHSIYDFIEFDIYTFIDKYFKEDGYFIFERFEIFAKELLAETKEKEGEGE